jgi:hypothetical protein
LNACFSDAVREGRKTTTIRDGIWPVGVPIMLYNWSGSPYRSPQIDVAAVITEGFCTVWITHRDDGGMIYAYGRCNDKPLHETEGFTSRADMDEWFRLVVKQGQTVEKHIMLFRLATDAELLEARNDR